jgi:uroporphyrinogen-III synthase
MRLIITRPEEDAGPLKTRLESMGHSASTIPLIKIVARSNVEIPDKSYQLICATSANALKSAIISAALKQIQILTVGPQSLAAARNAGFTSCEAHGGDVHGLVAYISQNYRADNGPVLYLAGSEISADLQKLLQVAGFRVEKAIVYDAVVQNPANMKQELVSTDGVLLYSPRSARIWVDLVKAENLEVIAEKALYYCLSENVANALPQSWRRRVAKSPDESAMLALLD